MTKRPEVTESKIRRWVGDGAFARGQGYFEKGNIVSPRLQGNTLRSLCVGSRSQSYVVEVTLGRHGIVSGECSCPVGGSGQCKHVAALLLTWLYRRQAFQELEEPRIELERRTRTELLATMLKVAGRQPDLEPLPELPAASGPKSSQPLPREMIRRQVDLAFAKAARHWKDPTRLSLDLQDVVDVGDVYAQWEDWRSAAIVYQTVALGVTEHYHEVPYDEGEMADIVYLCTDGLAECLKANREASERQELLRVLFEVYRWNVDSGGYGIGEDIPEIMLAQVSVAERQTVAQWVRKALPSGYSLLDVVRRHLYGRFLIQLLETQLDDESFLELCRETERLEDLVNRLLKLNRISEAVSEAARAGDCELLLLAELFVSHGCSDQVEWLIRQRVPMSDDARLSEWLKTRAEERGDLAEALTLAEALFWRQPSLEAYKDVRKLARKLKRWDTVQAECLTHLHDEREFGLLTGIHVLDGDVDRALESLEQFRVQRPSGVSPWSLEVACAAETSRPQEAVRLYMEEVERLVHARGRGNYAQAARCLLRVRAIYENSSDQAAWQELIASIRGQNRRLPAFQEELKRAGL